MKKTIIIILIFFSIIGVNFLSVAAEIEGENDIKENIVSTIFYETDIREALNELALQTGVNIIYDESITGTITLDLEDVSLEKALDLILLKGGFYYQKVGSVYLIGIGDPRGSTFRHLAVTETIHLKYLSSQEVRDLLPSFYINFLRISNDKPNLITINAPPSIISDFKKDLANIDKAEKEVNLQILVTEISTSYLRESGSDLFQYLNGDLELDYQVTLDGTLDVGINSRYGQFITHLRALEREDKAKIKANPSLRVLDKEKASLFVGEEQVIILEPENTSSRLERVEVGVSVSFTPEIIDDQKIRLNIKSDLSSFTDEREERLVVRRSDLSTHIYAKNGETITIAGITLEKEAKLESQVPILGNIPIMRWLFRKETETKAERELIIFITPKIIGVE